MAAAAVAAGVAALAVVGSVDAAAVRGQKKATAAVAPHQRGLARGLLGGALRGKAAVSGRNEGGYVWTEAWTTAWIDNFNGWANTSAATYQQRYLINDTYWAPGGPIFFYTGNEGDITLFAANTGLMWELAPSYGALLVFAEHRYYGESMPFGAASYDNANLGYLSSEQALADYAALLSSLKANLSAPAAPVISFGGSYGGMLAAWFRQKYPAATAGAIAASAPVLQFTGITPPTVYNGIVTRTFGAAQATAPAAIANSWSVMTSLANTQAGRNSIQGWLGICQTLASPSDVTNTVFNWISNAIGYMAMADYPYPASFLGPMPGWPVNVSAAYLTNPSAPPAALLGAINAGILQTFYNYSGQAGSCYNLTDLMPPGLEGDGWNVQSCMEMVMPIGQYGMPTDMFWVAPWSLPAAVAGCQATYATTPRPAMVATQYGVTDLRGASNIVFSNGLLDPWSGGGVTANVTGNPSIIAITISEGAHHLDLRASNPADPQSVITARAIESAAINTWLTSYYASLGLPLPY